LLRLRLPHTCEQACIDPLSGLTSLSEYHQTDSVNRVATRPREPAGPSSKNRSLPSRGCGPCSVLTELGSDVHPAETHLHRLSCTLRVSRPLDAFTPPRTCRAYFIPVPLLGLALQGLIPSAVPYALSGAESSMGLVVSDVLAAATPPSRILHTTKIPPGCSWVRRAYLRLPPWAFSPSRFSTQCDAAPTRLLGPTHLPSHAFSTQSQADCITGAPGSPSQSVEFVSLDTN
jgi:hypothetical protein